MVESFTDEMMNANSILFRTWESGFLKSYHILSKLANSNQRLFQRSVYPKIRHIDLLSHQVGLILSLASKFIWWEWHRDCSGVKNVSSKFRNRSGMYETVLSKYQFLIWWKQIQFWDERQCFPKKLRYKVKIGYYGPKSLSTRLS